MRFHRQVIYCAALLMASGVAACGGGGGGGGGGGKPPTAAPSGGVTPTPNGSHSPAVTPTPTGRPYSLPAPTGTALSQYTVNSLPTGLAVKINSGSSIGNTPQTVTPALSKNAYSIEVDPTTTSSPFIVTVGQYGNGSHTIYYSQALDTRGTIANLSSLSTRRRVDGAALVQPYQARRSGFSASGRPLFSSHRIAVVYDASKFGGSRTFNSVEQAHGAARALTLSQNSGRVSRVLTLASGRSVDSAMRELQAEPGVISVDHVRMRYPLAAYTSTFYPNDTFFPIGSSPAQWYLYNVDAPDAWGYGPGSAPVAVIDTGYDPNQTEVASKVTFSEKVLNGQIYAFAGAATDTDGHGTFLSGVAGAATNNAAGFAGMSYNAPLLEFKVTADAPAASVAADTADISQAIYDAVGNGAKVILIAFGGDASAGPDPNELTAVSYAISHNVVVVAGSGDDGGTATALDFPAGYNGVISVGASQYNDTASPPTESVASYSNAGPGLSLVAPGGQGSGSDSDLYHWIENVYTTQPYAGNPTCTTPSPASSCAILYTGTSPAAALVAGTASLMLTVNSSLNPASIAQILKSTTVNINDPNQGTGRLNSYQAVTMAAGGPPASPAGSPQPGFNPPAGSSFVAIAYTSNQNNAVPFLPPILNQTYPAGVPVNADGTFRMADIQLPTSGGYRIGVWLDLNGNGVIDAGDYFGSVTCGSRTAPCTANITASVVTATTKI